MRDEGAHEGTGVKSITERVCWGSRVSGLPGDGNWGREGGWGSGRE